MKVPSIIRLIIMKVLAEGKGDIMMCCLKEAREQSFELSLPLDFDTENRYLI
jgi:hypothetical protein